MSEQKKLSRNQLYQRKNKSVYNTDLYIPYSSDIFYCYSIDTANKITEESKKALDKMISNSKCNYLCFNIPPINKVIDSKVNGEIIKILSDLPGKVTY